MAVTGQFWYVGQGNPTDARFAYIDVNAASGTNTNSATTVVVDNSPTIDLQTGFPEDVQIDWAAGVYYVLVNGGPALGTGGMILMGHIGSAAAPTVVYTEANTNDALNTIQIDPFTHHLYLGVLEENGTPTLTGIRDFTYSTTTGALTPVATNGGFLVTANQQTAIPNDPNFGVPIFDPRDFALDHSTNQLFWVNETDGGAFTNEIYWLDIANPTVIHPLLQQSQFPLTTDGSPYPNGYITSVEVDQSTDLVYFTTHSQHPSPDATYNAATDKIYWINETATGSTAATALTITGLPSLFYPGKITFDMGTRQIYIVSEQTDTGSPTGDDVIYVLQLDASGHSASLVNTIAVSNPVFSNDSANISGLTFDSLADINNVNGTSIHAVEQSLAVTLLTLDPTITDLDGDHLANGTVKVSGSFVGSGDILSVAGVTSGLIAGTNITVAVTTDGSGNKTLTLSGYDTMAHYQQALGDVQFQSSGDNPTNFGGNTTRTLSWQVNDGAAGDPSGTANGVDTNLRTTTLAIDAVNDAPVATAPVAHYLATEQINLSLRNTGLAVSDADGGTTGQSETVTLSVGEGTITIAAGNSGISIDSGNSTNSVTFSGTIAQLNALLNTSTGTILYNDASDTPSASTTLTLTVHDNGFTGSGGDLSDGDSATIDITAVNDAPSAVLGTDPYAATEQIAVDIKNTGMSVSDIDALGAVEIATLSVTEGVLNVTAGGSGATVTNSGTNSVTITGTLAQINALLSSDATSTVSYTDNTDNPVASATLTLQINDGGNTGTGGPLTGTDTSTINITAVNDAPAATITPLTYSATEQTVLNLKNNGLAVSDVDGNAGSETVTLSVGEGTLNVSAGTSGAIVNNSGTNSVTITGTVAQINALLNTNGTSTVSYIDNTDTPSASTQLTLLVHDNGNTGGGDLSASDAATINIGATNDAPTALMTTDPYAATEQVALDLKGTGMSVSDVDSSGNVEVATLSVTEGTLNVGTGTSGATVTNSGTNSVTITGTLAQINALLNTDGASTVSYIDNTDNPGGSATLSLSINDGGNTGLGGPLTGTDTSTINITMVNDAPVATITPTTYGGQPGVVVDLKNNGLSVSDVDGNAGSETVTLSVDHGALTVTAGGSGAGVAGSGTNSVTITGTIAQINALLNTDGTSTVSFLDNAPTGPIHLTLAIHDNGNTGGGDQSAQDTATINLDEPPVVTGAGHVVGYTEQQLSPSAVVLENLVTITDPDGPGAGNQINSAIVKISAGALAGDVLAAVTTGTSITAVFNGTDTLTLTGADTILHYEDVLRSVTFASTSDNPTNFATDNSRTIDWTVKDNLDVESVAAHTTINIAPVNDAPVATITAPSYSATEPVFLDLKPGGLSVSDVDGGGGGGQIEIATLSVDAGTLNVTAGGSGAIVNMVDPATWTITGTIAQINALLSSDPGSTVSYLNPNDNPPASATLTLKIDDTGWTGVAGALTDSRSVLINITPTNDAPTLIGTLAGTVAEGGSHIITAGELGFTDPDDVASGVTFITAAALNGSIEVNGVAQTTFTAQQVIDGLVTFHHDGSETVAASFQVTVEDGNEDNSAPPAPVPFNLTVTPANDAPTLAVAAAASFTENGAAVTLDPALAVNDADTGVGYSATIQISAGFHAGDVLSGSGTFDAGTHTFTTSLAPNATLADLQTALQAVTFSSSSDDPTAQARTLTWTISDGSAGNPTSTTQTTVNVTTINDAPAGTDRTVTTLEDTAYVFKAADFGFTDIDGNSLAAVQVMTLPGHGSLTDNGVAVSAGQLVAVADILAGKLKFAPAHDANGAAYAHFTFQVEDDGGTALGGIDLDPTPNTLTIDVTPVADVTIITGTPHVDHLHGTGGADIIKGLGSNDTIYGHSGDDRIIGGRGADLLIGGAGHDTFVFTSIYDSAPNQSGIINNGGYSPLSGQGLRDRITDFTHGQDRIDLSAIDANTHVAGNQAFVWRGQGNFTHTPGQLIERLFDVAGTANDKTIVYADVNGDARADMQIELAGLKHLVASDFVL